MKSLSKILAVAAVVVLTVLSVRVLTPAASPSHTGASADSAQKTPGEAGPMMMELYSPYCPSCSQMAPLVRDLAADCASEGVSIVQFDISTKENEHLADELDIDAVPTFVFIDETGQETARLVGKQSAEALQDGLSVIGGAACGDRT